MASLAGYVIFLAAAGITLSKPAPTNLKDSSKQPLLMPGVQPKIKDTYLCNPVKVEEDAVYITGFEPVANSSTAHHMLLYGCQEPGDKQQVWNCGEMAAENPKYSVGPVCESGAKIIYAWAMDAPDLHLPEGVAFKVGAKTDIKWLVLQVHYKDVSHFLPPESKQDHSGIVLDKTDTPQPKRAGVYLLGTGGEIPAHSTVYMETACGVEDPVVIHPFAYRVHTHSHGKVVSGYRVRDGEWEEIGRQSPQKPQMFYSVSHPGLTIHSGDSVAARCTMVNNENHTILIGATQNDEMCNFYIMYWVDGDNILEEEYCFSDGSPNWFWSFDEQIESENAPGNASVVPGSDEILQASKAIIEKAEEKLEMSEEEMEQQVLKLLAMYGEEDQFDNYMENMQNLPYEQQQYENGYGRQYPEEGYYYNNEESDESLQNYPQQMYNNEDLQQYYREYDPQVEAFLSQLTPEQVEQYYDQLRADM